MGKEKKSLIFISHSSKNKEQVKMLAELLCSINMIPQQHVFCSSLPGFDIPIDTEDRIFDFLRSRFLEYNIHVFFIHSPEYYKSAVSLNEMGAAWVLKSKATSFLLPGFEFSDMKGVINGDRIAIKVDNDITDVKHRLNQLRRSLEEEFGLIPVPDITWEQARDKFIEEINRPQNNIRSGNISSSDETKKSLSPLEKRVLESGQAIADTLGAAMERFENSFEKRVLYASSLVTDDEITMLRTDYEKSVDTNMHIIDVSNHELVYRRLGMVSFKRKVDEFLNQNVIVSAKIEDIQIESRITYDNWRSKSYANNVLSVEDYECTIWFKILSEKDNSCIVHILLIEEC